MVEIIMMSQYTTYICLLLLQCICRCARNHVRVHHSVLANHVVVSRVGEFVQNNCWPNWTVGTTELPMQNYTHVHSANVQSTAHTPGSLIPSYLISRRHDLLWIRLLPLRRMTTNTSSVTKYKENQNVSLEMENLWLSSSVSTVVWKVLTVTQCRKCSISGDSVRQGPLQSYSDTGERHCEQPMTKLPSTGKSR
jgi:hypothetical protein